MGGFTQNFGANYTGTDPKKLAQNQGQYIRNYADWLNAQNQNQAGTASGQTDYYEQLLNNNLGDAAAGAGGYNPNEAGAIMGTGTQNGIPGLGQIGTTADQFAGNYLTPEEQAGIAGNPNYSGYFDPASMDESQQQSAGFQRGAVQGLQGNLNNAINPTALSQSQGYLDQAGQTVGENRANTMATLYGEAGNVRGSIDPSALKQSASAAQQIQMTPQQQQDIVTGAGISAGVRNAAAVGDLQRQTAAAGGSPLAVAAYRERMGRESAAEAGDAMTQARIQASNAAAARAQQSEAQRLGAQQYLTGEQTGSELSLGNQAMQAQQALGAQKLAQGNTQEAQRLAANQYLTGANLNAATVGGEAAIGGEQAINAQQRQGQQFNTQTGTGILQAQDQAAAAREQALAQNRQGVGMYNQQQQYGQGLTANQLASQRAGQVANTRLGTQQNALNQFGQLQGQKNANQQGAYGREQQTFGTATGGTGQATAAGVQASAQPGLFEKIAGGIIGAGGVASKFNALNPSGSEKGDVVTEPSLRTIGENGPEWVGPAADYMGEGQVVDKPTSAMVGESGPEAIVPLSHKPDAKVRPGAVLGKEQVRRKRPSMYGEAA